MERRRERAIALLAKGYQPVDVARLLNVDRGSVRRWGSAYSQHGLEGIKAKPSAGRPPQLSPRDKKKLERLLLKGVLATGFSD